MLKAKEQISHWSIFTVEIEQIQVNAGYSFTGYNSSQMFRDRSGIGTYFLRELINFYGKEGCVTSVTRAGFEPGSPNQF